MALRVGKKDMKKSSYYVWFLGAQEARNATGAKHALSALARLEVRAAASVNNPSPPTKVTLQVSGRGLKIIQNVAGRTVKHLLPADSVTEVRSKGDAVVCILLLYNPATRCPLHAHAYRCDSEQTAQGLSNQLRAIAGLGPEDEPEPEIAEDISSDIDSREAERYNERNTKNNIEPDLKTNSYDKRPARRGEDRVDSRERIDRERDERIRSRDRVDSREIIDPRDAGRIHSRDRVDSREIIDHSREMLEREARHASMHEARVPPVEMRLAPEQEVVAERLAAELRTRLAGREPLLLPPRDYDTNRRVPAAAPQVSSNKRLHRPGIVGSSAGSSGIGSDLAPSPERPHTSSEEDWNESTAYMLHDGFDVSVTPRRGRSPSPTKHHVRKSVSPKDRFNVAKEKFMNLEREKINEEIEKRVQMKKSLNMAFSRGPLLPSEIKKDRRFNSWDEDDDGLMEMRRDIPRAAARNDPRDMRRNEFRDERPEPRGRDSREVRDFRDSRYGRDYRDQREPIRSSGARDPLDLRDLREQRPIREERSYKEYRDRDPRDYREYKEPNDRYGRNVERNGNEYGRDVKDSRDVLPGSHKESRDCRYGREYRDEIIEEPRRVSREKTPQLEQRYFEYKGERNDKYFENRYTKHDSRSDDEGVESEKQFEEIRYVPHVELSRRREIESKIIPKVEPKKEPVRDGRIELFEERQRQIESGRIRVPPVVDSRFDRNMDHPVMRSSREAGNNNGEWDVIRRSYGDADRQRRDPRNRHSYAEPVARTRVGMATVAPF